MTPYVFSALVKAVAHKHKWPDPPSPAMLETLASIYRNACFYRWSVELTLETIKYYGPEWDVTGRR